jgi:hypothetical protein
MKTIQQLHLVLQVFSDVSSIRLKYFLFPSKQALRRRPAAMSRAAAAAAFSRGDPTE